MKVQSQLLTVKWLIPIEFSIYSIHLKFNLEILKLFCFVFFFRPWEYNGFTYYLYFQLSGKTKQKWVSSPKFNPKLLVLSLIKFFLMLSSKHRGNPRKLMITPSLSSSVQIILWAILKHLAENVLLFKRALATRPSGKVVQKSFRRLLLYWGSVEMCLTESWILISETDKLLNKLIWSQISGDDLS